MTSLALSPDTESSINILMIIMSIFCRFSDISLDSTQTFVQMFRISIQMDKVENLTGNRTTNNIILFFVNSSRFSISASCFSDRLIRPVCSVKFCLIDVNKCLLRVSRRLPAPLPSVFAFHASGGAGGLSVTLGHAISLDVSPELLLFSEPMSLTPILRVHNCAPVQVFLFFFKFADLVAECLASAAYADIYQRERGAEYKESYRQRNNQPLLLL